MLAGLVFAISLLLRSEWFLRHRIDPELERLGSKLHGTFEYESVAPEGMTGIRVEGLRFTPDYDFEGEAVEPIAIDTLIVYPNLSAMLTGDIEPDRVEIEGLHAEFLLDGGPTNRGHWPWLEGVVDDWRQRSGKISSGGGGGGGGGPSPQLVVRDSRIKVRSPGGTMPEVGLSLDEVLIEKVNGEFKLDGGIHVDGLGYALLSGDANHMTRQGGVVVKLVDKPDLLAIAPQRDRVKEVVGRRTPSSSSERPLGPVAPLGDHLRPQAHRHPHRCPRSRRRLCRRRSAPSAFTWPSSSTAPRSSSPSSTPACA